MYVHRVRRVVFSMFGGLGGDLYKDTYEAKLFGMHGGRCSVMWTSHVSQPFRRLRIPNLCLGSKMSVYGKKMTFFRWLEVLEGTFVRTHMSQSCLGCILEVF